jgi:hypothetical protein
MRLHLANFLSAAVIYYARWGDVHIVILFVIEHKWKFFAVGLSKSSNNVKVISRGGYEELPFKNPSHRFLMKSLPGFNGQAFIN